jgi:DNA-directed RNA polymerase specialized sigma24 family protein
MTVEHDNEDLLAGILVDLKRFARRLGLPVHLHHLYDDIIQDTMILVHRKWATLMELDAHLRTGWVCNAMFNVTRNTTRAEVRQTQAWERLTNTAFENAEVKEYFDRADGAHTDIPSTSSASSTENSLSIVCGQAAASPNSRHHTTLPKQPSANDSPAHAKLPGVKTA